MSETPPSIGTWYAEHMHLFPDLVSGECEYCGPTEMIVEYDDGSHSCYFCGATSEVTVDE
jgi:hypothetical protein